MDTKSLKMLYDAVKRRHDDTGNDACLFCSDIDCSKCCISKMLKKKHQINVIDYVRCKKQMKARHAEFEKILRDKMFASVSMRKCFVCHKALHELDTELALEIKKEAGKKFYPSELDTLCKPCYKAYKKRKEPLHKGYDKFS